jgi:hypothetical protein
LVVDIAFSVNQPVALHAGQHTAQAGADDEGFTRNVTSFNASASIGVVLAQHTQDPPLLITQAMFAQPRTRVRHDRFTCL